MLAVTDPRIVAEAAPFIDAAPVVFALVALALFGLFLRSLSRS